MVDSKDSWTLSIVECSQQLGNSWVLAIFERFHNDIFLISPPPCFFLCKGFGGGGGGAVAVWWKHIFSQWWFGAIPFQMVLYLQNLEGFHSFLLVSIFPGDLYMRCCCIFVSVLLLLIAFSTFLEGDFCRIAWLITAVAIRNNNWTMPTMPSLTMMEMRSEHIQIRLRRPQRPSSLFSTCNMPTPPPDFGSDSLLLHIYPSFEYPPTLDNWTMPCISDAPVQYDDVEGNGD